MALYDSLFTMMDMQAAQLLVTATDFEHEGAPTVASQAASGEHEDELITAAWAVLQVWECNVLSLSCQLRGVYRFNAQASGRRCRRRLRTCCT